MTEEEQRQEVAVWGEKSFPMIGGIKGKSQKNLRI